LKCFIECREGNCEVDICARQKNTLPILFAKKTKSGLYWYVRFRDEKTQAYNTVRSTGIPVEGNWNAGGKPMMRLKPSLWNYGKRLSSLNPNKATRSYLANLPAISSLSSKTLAGTSAPGAEFRGRHPFHPIPSYVPDF
jgi:hypothetical protein